MYVPVLILLFIFITAVTATLLQVAALYTARTATAKRRVKSKVNVLLSVDTDQEGRDVYELLANTNVTLADQHTGVMNALGETELEDEGLETTFQHVLRGQREHIIQLGLILREESVLVHAAEEGFALKETAAVFFVEGEEITGTGTDLGENHLHAPQLALVSQAIFAHHF